MSYDGYCGGCKYADSGETCSYKWHCDLLGIYVDPDEEACSHFVPRGASW